MAGNKSLPVKWTESDLFYANVKKVFKATMQTGLPFGVFSRLSSERSITFLTCTIFNPTNIDRSNE